MLKAVKIDLKLLSHYSYGESEDDGEECKLGFRSVPL
jgi:hypothetical protein